MDERESQYKNMRITKEKMINENIIKKQLRIPRMNTDRHGCLGLMFISRTRVGFIKLLRCCLTPVTSNSFIVRPWLSRHPTPSQGLSCLKLLFAIDSMIKIFNHEEREEHEGLELINSVMVSLSNPCLWLMVVIL